MAKSGHTLALMLKKVMDAAAERVRGAATETGNRDVLQLLNKASEFESVMNLRAEYINTMTQEAQRLGDLQRVQELAEMRDDFVRRLTNLTVAIEEALPAFAPKGPLPARPRMALAKTPPRIWPKRGFAIGIAPV